MNNQLDVLIPRLYDIVENMTQGNGTEYNEGLETFLKIKEISRNNSEIPSITKVPQQRLTIQQNELNDKKYELQFYISQINKLKRENEGSENYLAELRKNYVSNGNEHHYHGQYESLRVELSERIRLEKELLEEKKKLKESINKKKELEVKLNELNSQINLFADSNISLRDNLQQGGIFKSSSNISNMSEDELNVSLLPHPLYLLFKTIQQAIKAHKKNDKMSVSIQRDENQRALDLDIHNFSIHWAILVKENLNTEATTILLQFEFSKKFDIILVTPTVVFSDVINNSTNNNNSIHYAPNLLDQLIPNNYSGNNYSFTLPTSCKALTSNSLINILNNDKGKVYDWVQSLCGYSLMPHFSLSYHDRVNYAPLQKIVNYKREKQNNSIITPVSMVVEETGDLEIIEIENDHLNMNIIDSNEEEEDSRRINSAEREIDEEKEIDQDIGIEVENNEDSNKKNDNNNEMVIESKEEERNENIDSIEELKLREGISITINLSHMIIDHWRNNRSSIKIL